MAAVLPASNCAYNYRLDTGGFAGPSFLRVSVASLISSFRLQAAGEMMASPTGTLSVHFGILPP